MSDLYILENGVPVKARSSLEWGEWFEKHRDERVVAKTALANGVRVSTVFLGVDHSWNGPPPLLYETMVFGGPHDGDQERYSTRKQALEGHDQMVTSIQAGVEHEKK